MLRPVGSRNPYQTYQPEQNGQHFPLLANQQSQMQNQQQAQMVNQTQGSVDGQSNAASGPSSGPEMSLAGVLHYLQSEWRRWERDRNEWEIERAEMRARIALLEGQRRSAENLKVDLLRRVKMLEYALRQERTKSMGTRATSLAPSRISAIQDEDKASNREEKEGSPSSEGSDEGDRPKVNGTKPTPAASKLSAPNNTENPWKNVGTASRDPKARARSREYLKQCLQEITYLTSPGALNPLPPRPPIDLDPQPEHPEEQERDEKYQPPRKSLPEEHIPSQYESSSLMPNGNGIGSPEKHELKPESNPDRPGPTKTIESRAMGPNATARPPHSPLPKPVALPEADPPADEPNEDHQMLTAIYRPDSKTAWREELQAANEKAEKARSQKGPHEQSDEDQLANLTLTVEDEDTKTDIEGLEKTWVTRRSLRSHLEIVRTVAMDHAPGHLLQLVSGGDDNVVKVWSIDPESVRAPRPNAPELEPIMTYRGHTSPITSLAISHQLGTVFSGSLDSTIRVWRLPPVDHDPYASYDPKFTLQTLEGHADAIWDLILVPVSPHAQRLVSISADTTIRTWSLNGESWSASASYSLDGTPTCLGSYAPDMSKVLVGFASGSVQLWDLEAGEAITTWQDQVADGDAASQVNAVLSHPTLPIVVFGCEDGTIRTYDSAKGSSTPTHKVVAHSDPVTSLVLSPINPMFLFTASTDCRIRAYDIEKNVFLQDLTGHRARSDEGVCGLGAVPEVPVLASAGADGVIRLWAQS